MPRKQLGASTKSVHAGEDRNKPEGSLTNPIFQTATYTFANTQALIDFKEGVVKRVDYGRYGNPTQRTVERKLAQLDSGEDALLFSSGMCAITTALIALLKKDSHVIMTEDCYKRTRDFCREILAPYGVTVTLVKADGIREIEKAVKKNTVLMFSESPTNPYLHVVDMEKIAAIGKKHNLKVLIDSTFATPYNQRPLEFGVDLVIHSATKYLAGHNDLLAGVVIGDGKIVKKIRETQSIMGGVIDPHNAYMLLRGLKTFALRMERHNENGMKVSRFLESHPMVKKVYYPGLASHKDHKIACAQMKGFGGVVSFELNADVKKTSRFIDKVKIPYIGPSLGGVESLIEQPLMMTYYHVSEEDKAKFGIKGEFVRLSLGIEDTADLIEDLKQALDGI
jgi:cystathionine gamma-synthase